MDNIKNKEEEFTIPIYDQTGRKVWTMIGIVGSEAYQQICKENGGELPQRFDIDSRNEGLNPFIFQNPKGGWKELDMKPKNHLL